MDKDGVPVVQLGGAVVQLARDADDVRGTAFLNQLRGETLKVLHGVDALLHLVASSRDVPSEQQRVMPLLHANPVFFSKSSHNRRPIACSHRNELIFQLEKH